MGKQGNKPKPSPQAGPMAAQCDIIGRVRGHRDTKGCNTPTPLKPSPPDPPSPSSALSLCQQLTPDRVVCVGDNAGEVCCAAQFSKQVSASRCHEEELAGEEQPQQMQTDTPRPWSERTNTNACSGNRKRCEMPSHQTLMVIERDRNLSEVYVVMELCAKGDLLKHINVKGALPDHSSWRFFTQLCEAIQYLHSRDVAHRDIKCENLLLDRYHNLKVCDFGFSKSLTYIDGRMVLSETYCGTSSYAAPEILRSFPYNPKVSDVWSMGIVLYMMLYATMPYEANNVTRMVGIQMQHNIDFPNSPSVSFEAKDLIRSLLHPVVEKRITISNILQSSWVLREGRMEDTDADPTSHAGSGQGGPTDEKAKEEEKLTKNCSDPGEGPSTAATRH
ncbi:testis-specific serine/threonine-protein kinase 2-like [Morone saxatilis]|uniref:testis-specific serine/threonine-protein kinase 2-like n=1 Tax=Morone saxatilis TaxID=34816 RepID=UPI0015E1E37F|nr:testis-specific serine/threonine-protein kinase 2-like [Morone saxatilis]